MPSFDLVSDVDMQEVDNALNQARKEIATRFDFKTADAHINLEKDKILLTSNSGPHIRSLSEVVLARLAKRNVPLQNIDRGEVEISPMGHGKQELIIKKGIPHDKAKEIQQAIRDGKFKITMQFQEDKIRVTGKSRDELQEVIAFVRSKDFELALSFENFRN